MKQNEKLDPDLQAQQDAREPKSQKLFESVPIEKLRDRRDLFFAKMAGSGTLLFSSSSASPPSSESY